MPYATPEKKKQWAKNNRWRERNRYHLKKDMEMYANLCRNIETLLKDPDSFIGYTPPRRK